MLDLVTGWLFAWVSQNDARIAIYIAVAVIAILMWAAASLLELGTEFGVSALAGLIIAGNSGFFLGLAVFTILFIVLFMVMGSVVGRWGLAADFVAAVLVAWYASATFGHLFGLAGFAATFLLIGGVLNRVERGPSPSAAARLRA